MLPNTGAEVSAKGPGIASSADWHLLECGGYGADLPSLRRLAEGCDLVGDLGCGCGRVARELARTGVEVVAIDHDPNLLESLDRIAGSGGVSAEIRAVEADVTVPGWSGDLPRPMLAIAAMQLWQVLPAAGALNLAEEVAGWLTSRGLFAVAVLDPERSELSASGVATAAAELRPNLREVDGWVLSSEVTAVRESRREIEVHRLRQQVSPDGDVMCTASVDRLRRVSLDEVERELRSTGFEPLERIPIPAEPESVPCAIIVAEVAA